MNRAEWRQELGELVRQAMRSPELEHYFRVKITKPGAQVLITQLGLFIHHRRDCWAHVSGNCPHMSIKQKILQHEYGEVIKDEYTEHGHMELIIRQGKALGLTPDEVLNVEPLPSTMATLYAWAWIAREKSWLEGLASIRSPNGLTTTDCFRISAAGFPAAWPSAGWTIWGSAGSKCRISKSTVKRTKSIAICFWKISKDSPPVRKKRWFTKPLKSQWSFS